MAAHNGHEASMNIAAFIPARGGSRGLPGKNLARINGKSLLRITIEHARASRFISHVYVSSDSADILGEAVRCGAIPILRPRRLASDTSPTEDAVLHFLLMHPRGFWRAVVLLQCTSPIRRQADIDNAISRFLVYGYDSMFSGSRLTQFVWRKAGEAVYRLAHSIAYRPMRQGIWDIIVENGSFWISSPECYFRHHNRLAGRIGYYLQPWPCGIEIDTKEDLIWARKLMKK